mgnify:CR=1 FL=1
MERGGHIYGKISRTAVQEVRHQENLCKKGMKEAAKAENAPKAEAGAFLDDATRQALAPVLARFTRPIRLRLYTDDSQMTEETAAW